MDTPQLLLAVLLAVCVADSKAFNCTKVTCPHGTVLMEGASAVQCPEDSDRPLISELFNGEPSVGADLCCLGPCKCKSPCPLPPTNCPVNSPARVLKPATGRPGSCCPKYHCASPHHEDNSPVEPPALALHSPHASDNMWESYPGGCISERTGEIMENGFGWQEDPCTTCRCDVGKKSCQVYMCQKSCINPRHDPEECCPVCDSASVVTLPPHCPSLANCSLRCSQGMLKDKEGCFLCQCQTEECNLDCPHGYAEDSLGEKLCECAKSPCPPLNCKRNCTHGLRTNRNGCPVCKCFKCKQILFSSSTPNPHVNTEGIILESTAHEAMLLCAGACQYGHIKDDRSCPTCRCNDPPRQFEEITTIYSEDVTNMGSLCISSEGNEMGPNDVWWDGCRKCHCFEGLESCTMINCPPDQNAGNTQIPNQDSTANTTLWLIILGLFLFISLILNLILGWNWCPWKQRRMFTCNREKEEDGSDVRLEVSPSPSPTCSPTQKNGTSKVSRYRKEKCLSSHGVQEPFCKNIL